jgi:hypothetical protein
VITAMRYYIRTLPDGSLNGGIWRIDDQSAQRVGITNAPIYYAESGLTVLESIRRKEEHWFSGEGGFHELKLAPGEFYPRMARPSQPGDGPGSNPGAQAERSSIAVARGQLLALTAQLARICQTVHPTAATLDVFGHEIRNLIILACTEAEAHWRNVLIANGMKKREFNVERYAALGPAMRLAEYAVSFPNFPWLEPVRPFANWAPATPGLAWYQVRIPT